MYYYLIPRCTFTFSAKPIEINKYVFIYKKLYHFHHLPISLLTFPIYIHKLYCSYNLSVDSSSFESMKTLILYLSESVEILFYYSSSQRVLSAIFRIIGVLREFPMLLEKLTRSHVQHLYGSFISSSQLLEFTSLVIKDL